MNIAVPHEIILRPVTWKVFFEDETYTESNPATWWSDICTTQEVDGIPLPLTRKNAVRLFLSPQDIYGDCSADLLLPEPCPAFAFLRYQQALQPGSEPHLLYAAFGYVLPNYLFLLKFHRSGSYTEHRLLPRPLTSPLW